MSEPKNEFELKATITSPEEMENLELKALTIGFKKSKESLLTDYTVDTAKSLCKTNNIILRFRQETNSARNANNYIVTLKKTVDNSHVQQNVEFEWSTEETNNNAFWQICNVLRQTTNFSMDNIDFDVPLEQLIHQLRILGFAKCRMLSQKRRTEYSRGRNKICFDCFPVPVGQYLEIESCTEDEIYRVIDELTINPSRFSKSNYGNIIKAELRKECAHPLLQRICVFDTNLKEAIIRILGDAC